MKRGDRKDEGGHQKMALCGYQNSIAVAVGGQTTLGSLDRRGTVILFSRLQKSSGNSVLFPPMNHSSNVPVQDLLIARST